MTADENTVPQDHLQPQEAEVCKECDRRLSVFRDDLVKLDQIDRSVNLNPDP